MKTPRGEMPKVAELLDFLDSRFHIMETVETVKGIVGNDNKNTNRKNKFDKNSLAFTTTT